MQNFGLFFRLGVEHIADWKGYDHILFVASLCLTYLLKDWKKVLILVTAFSIGHSVTLALSVYKKILIPSGWIEFLIPVTILVSALYNLYTNYTMSNGQYPISNSSDQLSIANLPAGGQGQKSGISDPQRLILYSMALFFGLIHGMGFSNYLKSLMGKSENIIAELFAFNIGLEAGQLLIVSAVLLVSYIFVVLFRVKRAWWVMIVSILIALMALQICIDRFPI